MVVTSEAMDKRKQVKRTRKGKSKHSKRWGSERTR